MLAVNQPMHVLPNQLLFPLVAENAQASWVAKGALSLQVDAVDGFRRGIQQELELIFTLIELRSAFYHSLFQLQMGLE